MVHKGRVRTKQDHAEAKRCDRNHGFDTQGIVDQTLQKEKADNRDSGNMQGAIFAGRSAQATASRNDKAYGQAEQQDCARQAGFDQPFDEIVMGMIDEAIPGEVKIFERGIKRSSPVKSRPHQRG